MYKINKELFKKDALLIVLIFFMFIISFILYPFLPDKIPMHWNFRGEIDRYGSKFEGTFLIPLMTLGFYLLFLFLPYLDPKEENYKKFERVYQFIKYAFVILFSIMHYSVFITTLFGVRDLIPKIVPLTVGIFFILLGNYMPRIKPNWFVGIRTPWTLSNEEVWRKTHRLGGYLFIISGLLIILAGFLPSHWNFIVLMLAVFLSSIISIIYSFVIYKRLKGKIKEE